MKRLKSWSLPAALIVSILLHYAVFRVVHYEKKDLEREVTTYEVNLLYYTSPVKEKTKPKKVLKKKKTVKKIAEKKDEPQIEEQPLKPEDVEEAPEEKGEEISEAPQSAAVSEAPQSAAEEGLKAPPAEEQEEQPVIDYSSVIEGLRRKIIAKKIYPSIARKKGLQGVVTVLLKLDKEGNLVVLKLMQSSGYKVLDKAALSLVKKVVPYKHGIDHEVTIEIPIKYNLLN